MRAGELYDYFYLWHRQAEAGEESGRKARPVCLALVSARDPQRLFLFPITTQPPSADRAAFALHEIDCRRGQLRYPSWLILDEYNVTVAEQLTDFGAVEPRGELSPATLQTVLQQIRRLQAAARLRGVNRNKD